MRCLTFIFVATFFSGLQAQVKMWTLEQCIQHAVEHSLDARDAELTVDQTELSYKQSKMLLLPDLNGSAGQYFQSGRSIDRFTNTFVRKNIQSTNFALSSSIFLYAGGQVWNRINTDKYSWLASESDLNAVEQTISLNTANLFLQIAQAKELVNSVKENLENTIAQLDKAERQFAAGSINEGMVLNLKAQKANDEAAIINAENAETTALISLKLLLRIPFEEEFDIQLPEVSGIKPEPYAQKVSDLFNSALSKRPDIKAAELRVQSSMFYRKYAKGAMTPALSFGVNMGTVYSSNALYVRDTIKGEIVNIGRVVGTNQLVEAQRLNYDLATIKFSEQMKNNFGNTVGFNLSVPIFGRLSERGKYITADIDLQRNQLNLERSKQTLYNEVVAAYTAYESALSKFRANQLSYDAQLLNLDFVQKRFDGGQGSATDLQLAKTTANMSKVSLVSARYEYIFRKLILDFYMGQKLELH